MRFPTFLHRTPFVRRTALALLLCTFAAVTLYSSALFARDRDGSKIQARPLKLSSQHADSIKPPDDKMDWFYVKVETKSKLHISLSNSAPVTIALYDSANIEKWSQLSTKGNVSKSIEVEAGIYFIAIEASENNDSEVNYRLKVDS